MQFQVPGNSDPRKWPFLTEQRVGDQNDGENEIDQSDREPEAPGHDDTDKGRVLRYVRGSVPAILEDPIETIYTRNQSRGGWIIGLVRVS